MTDDVKRPRGRPKGSGKDDSAALSQIADLLLESPSLKPTTAMKRLGFHNDADIRRLQGKWRVGHESLLACARTRKGKATCKRPDVPNHGLLPALSGITRRVEELRRTMEGPAAKMFELQRNIDRALGPARVLIIEMEKREDVIRQALGAAETVRRLQEAFNPWGLRTR